MAIFGPQDILSRDDREALYEIAGVRAYAGALDRSLHIKHRATRPDPLRARRLIESARVQQRLSDARAAHWAHVHLIGATADTAYTVTTYYPHSAAALIELQAHIGAATLHRIVSRTVQGLREIHEIASRGHGNLKPSNILFGGDPARTAVVLTDPDPVSGTPARDAEALGQLIHQLVLHRPFAGPWPIPRSAAWTGLGRTGMGWHRLCAALLHPNPARRLTSLRRIAAAVRRLRPRPIFLARPLPLAGAAALVLGGVWIWMHGPYHMEQAEESTVVELEGRPVLLSAAPQPPPTPATTPAARPTQPQRQIPHLPDLKPVASAIRQGIGAGARLLEESATQLDRSATAIAAARTSGVAPIQEAWKHRAERLASEYRASPGRLSQIQARADRWKAVFLELDRQYAALPSSVAIKSSASSWSTALTACLNELARRQRDHLLAGALQRLATLEDPPDSIPALREGWDTWALSANKLAADMSTVETLLTAGYRPDEAPGEASASPQQILQAWQGDPLFKSESVQTALQPLLAPIQVLSSATPAALLESAQSSATPLGIRLAAWRQLATPATHEQLSGTLRAAESLLAATAGIPDEGRRKRVAADIESTSRRRWAAFVERADKADDIEFALSFRGEDSPGELPELSPRSRYNVLLHDLRKALASPKALPATQAIDASRKLLEAASSLTEDQRQAPPTADLLAAVRELGRPLDAADFRFAGPMSPDSPASELIPWKVQYDARNDLVTYTAHLSEDITRDEAVLVFRRVTTDPDSPPVYLCTTETPVGLFIDLVSALDKWRDMAPMLWNYDPQGADPRPGPRTWEWSKYRRPSQGIRRTVSWLEGRADHYPPQLATADNSAILKDADGRAARLLNPSKRQPMQYISPRAALYFARLLGCRPQSPAEWKAAWREFGCNRPNLRDHTWKLQARWASGSPATSAYYPDGGIFRPSGASPTSATWSASALGLGGPDRDYDDGCLWFVEVFTETPTVFNHLVGNVAEYAMEGSRMYVIGGSAMSAPSLQPDKEAELADWQDSKGYSDVGLRLAFTAPTHDTQRLAAAAKAAPYLFPPAAPRH